MMIKYSILLRNLDQKRKILGESYGHLSKYGLQLVMLVQYWFINYTQEYHTNIGCC